MLTAKTLIRLGGCPGFAGHTVILLVLSCRGSNMIQTFGPTDGPMDGSFPIYYVFLETF